MNRCEKIFRPADILIPKNGLEKWSVVACDQYTSEPDYWKEVETQVGDYPSTLKVIFPEVYLEEEGSEKRIKNINSTMEKYLEVGLFNVFPESFVYARRHISNGKIRKGIIGAIDLEEYDFSRGSKSLVRATEGTVLDRIPPRVKVRINATLELPHIMVLIDDEGKRVVEQFEKRREDLPKLYDFELMCNGGRIEGYELSGEDANKVISGIECLYEEKLLNSKDGNVLLFAMGDGNHSLATAKTCWEETKKGLSEKEIAVHPARYALCEIQNIHDDSLEFEPIHRILFGCDPKKVEQEFLTFYPQTSKSNSGGHCFEFLYGNKVSTYYVKKSASNLPVGTLQNFLDYYVEKYGGRIDYIHGEDVVRQIASEKGNIGFLLPSIKKSELFETVIIDGALPRKTFSMGEAQDKRFYLECRKIK